MLKAKGLKARLTVAEADKRNLRDKIVHMKGVERSQHAAYVELSDKYASGASRVAQLPVENERLRGEKDTAPIRLDTEVERLWALAKTRIAEFQSQS